MTLGWNKSRLLYIFSIFLQSLADPIALTCPPFDTAGNPLAAGPGRPNAGTATIWVCSYPDAGECSYDSQDVSNSYHEYCSISFKSTPGVTRDPKNQFDISTTAKIWRDTSEIVDIGTKILAFLRLTANFEPCVTLGRFDNRRRDA
jgi:hypothetical protein